jgi:hypothetical protein
MDGLLEPGAVAPTGYDVSLVLYAAPRFCFEGIVRIGLLVGQPLSTFRLHATALAVSSARLLPLDVAVSIIQVGI